MLSSIALFSESLVYQPLAWCRNIGYNNRLLPVARYDIPLIAVGNLSIRGTGKTPMADYLFKLLQNEFNISILSHGHGRTMNSTGADGMGRSVEPEPFYLARKKNPDRKYAIEDSKTAIGLVLEKSPETEVFILDDAFHQRKVKAGLNILITEFRIPFYKEDLLPYGRLLEPAAGYKRADIIMVTECSEGLTDEQKHAIIKRIKPLPGQHVFFSGLSFGAPYDFYTGARQRVSSLNNAILLDAQQHLRSMAQYLIANGMGSREQTFMNGQYFTVDDLRLLQMINHEWKLPILIREQESMRMLLYRKHLKGWKIPLSILPVSIRISGGNAPFDKLIRDYVRTSRKSSS